MSPFLRTAKTGDKACLQAMLENKADAKDTGSYGWNALHFLGVNQHLQKPSPLYVQAGSDALVMVDSLCKAGCPIEQTNRQGHTPLAVALGAENLPMIRALDAHGAQLKEVKPQIFEQALGSKNRDVVQSVLEKATKENLPIYSYLLDDIKDRHPALATLVEDAPRKEGPRPAPRAPVAAKAAVVQEAVPSERPVPSAGSMMQRLKAGLLALPTMIGRVVKKLMGWSDGGKSSGQVASPRPPRTSRPPKPSPHPQPSFDLAKSTSRQDISKAIGGVSTKTSHVEPVGAKPLSVSEVPHSKPPSSPNQQL